jgi:hypothetical protein
MVQTHLEILLIKEMRKVFQIRGSTAVPLFEKIKLVSMKIYWLILKGYETSVKQGEKELAFHDYNHNVSSQNSICIDL